MSTKYRELKELKGLIRASGETYESVSKATNITISSFSNKINGKAIFNLLEVDRIREFLNIDKNKLYVYFF